MVVVPQRWVSDALLGEIAATLVLCAVLFGHGWLRRWRHGRDQRRLAPAFAALAPVLNAAGAPRGALAPVRRLSPRLLAQFLLQVGASLNSAGRRPLLSIAQRGGLVENATGLARSRLWWRRLEGIRLLRLLGADADLLPSPLRDRECHVRAEAAQWAGECPAPSPALVGRLLAMLADPAGICRFRAKDALLQMGAAVVPELAEHLAAGGTALEDELEVAVGLADPLLLEPALHLVAHPAPRVRALASALLAMIGGPRGTAALQGALADPVPSVRAAAAAGLGQLHHLAAIAPVAQLLRDPAWDVRRAAAMTLREFGPAGLLLLRRALADEDRFAADTARQVLGIPEASV